MTSQLQMPTIGASVSYTPLYDSDWFDVTSPTPVYSTPIWVDISQYVQSFSTTSGRQHELDQIQAGTLTMDLDNRTGLFNPWAASPMVPMTLISVEATWDAVTYPIFYGFVNSVAEVDPDFTNSDVTVDANDLFAFLALQLLDSSGVTGSYSTYTFGGIDAANGLYENLVFYQGVTSYYLFGQDEWWIDFSGNNYAAGSAPLSASIPSTITTGGQGPILYVTAKSVSLGDNSSSANPSGYIFLPQDAVSGDASWTIEFWTQCPVKSIKPGNTAASIPANQVYMYYASSDDGSNTAAIVGDLVAQTVSWVSGSASVAAPFAFNDGNWHYIAVGGSDRTDGEITIHIDGVQRGSGSSSGDINPYISNSFVGTTVLGDVTGIVFIGGWYNTLTGNWEPAYPGSIAQWAFYPNVLSDTTTLTHYTIGSYFGTEVYSGERITQCFTVAGGSSTFIPSTVATGTQLLQSETSPVTGTSPFDYMVSVQQTESGLLFMAPNGDLTFYDRNYVTDNAGSGPVVGFTDLAASVVIDPTTESMFEVTNCNYEPNPKIVRDDLDLWPSISVTRQNGITQVARDEAAILQYGNRVGPTGGLNGMLFAAASVGAPDYYSRVLAQWLLSQFHTSIPRVAEVKLASTSNQGRNFPYMLGLQLWQQIYFARHYAPEAPHFDQDSVIEYIAHDVTVDKWVTTYALSPYELLAS